MTNKEKILFEATKKRLSEIANYDSRIGINEFTIVNPTVLDEKDDTEDASQGDEENVTMGGDPNAMGGDPNAMGGDPNAMGEDPNAMGGDPNAMGGDPNAMGGEANTPEGLNPQIPNEDPNAMGGDMSIDSFEGPSEDDDVVDVTELTDAQKETEDEIEKIGGKFRDVLHAIKNFEELIKNNDAKLEDLKADFERRNPTQVEKLSMQTAHSYPFNVTPEEYWKEKEATSNYSTEDDNNGKEQGQYVITAKDVNGDTNWNEIAKSLDDNDFMYNQTLNKILKLAESEE